MGPARLTDFRPVAQDTVAQDTVVQDTVVQDIGLFVVLLIAADALILPGLTSPGLLSATEVMIAFRSALIVQVMATLYVGIFGITRTVTWLLLIAVWTASEVAVFAS